jgi:hypothetical protein
MILAFPEFESVSTPWAVLPLNIFRCTNAELLLDGTWESIELVISIQVLKAETRTVRSIKTSIRPFDMSLPSSIELPFIRRVGHVFYI